MYIFKNLLICAIISVKCHYVLMAGDIMQTYYQNQCYTVTGNKQHFEILQNNFNRLYTKYTDASQDLKDCTEYFCGEPRTELMYETKEIRKLLLACHTNNNKFLGRFLTASFEGLLKFWCYNDGNYTIRYYSAETQQCQRDINSRENAKAFHGCVGPFLRDIGKNRTSQETCKVLRVTKICIRNLIMEICKGVEQVDLFEKFFHIIYTPCNGVCKFGTSSILIITFINFFVN